MKLLITTQVVDTEDPMLGFFHEWVRAFSADFERIDVICLRRGHVELPRNVHVHSLGKEEGENRIKYLFRFYQYFSKLFFRERVTHVFFHMGALYNVLALPFFLVRKCFGTEFYWWKTHGHINILGRLALHCVDRVYTASTESFPIETQKRRVVGHAIIPYEHEHVDRSYLGPTLRIGCVGRVTTRKRQDIVVEVAKLLREKRVPYTITFVGHVVDQMFYDELLERIEKEALTDTVQFLGDKTAPQTRELMEHFDVLIHPSETGSIDKVVLEAMDAGALPIALDHAYHDLLGAHGLTVPKNVALEYAAVVEQIREYTPDSYRERIKDLRAIVARDHSLQTLSRRIFGTP